MPSGPRYRRRERCSRLGYAPGLRQVRYSVVRHRTEWVQGHHRETRSRSAPVSGGLPRAAKFQSFHRIHAVHAGITQQARPVRQDGQSPSLRSGHPPSVAVELARRLLTSGRSRPAPRYRSPAGPGTVHVFRIPRSTGISRLGISLVPAAVQGRAFLRPLVASSVSPRRYAR